MQDGIALERKTREELKQLAMGLGIPKVSALKKDEIIALIRRHREEAQKQAQAEKRPERKRPSDVVEVCGVLDVMADGFGFLRFENYRPSDSDVYVSPTQIRRFNLKTGDEIRGDSRPSQEEDKYSPLLFVKSINGDPIDVALKRKNFERLTPIYPTEKLTLDTGNKTKYASRLLDIIAPIGKGQRGMIVAPPKAGKTTLIKQIAQSISKNHPDVTLIVLLIDERPEEVTDMKRSIDGDVIYSTFDQTPENHTKVAEMVLERAQRLVEQKKDVVILLDSITRLARAYNLTVAPTGRTLSGGLDPDALIKPKKFFGAARNIEEGGSLTILATALVETGSRMDDVIFEEFKGTGNMELKLDRGLQEKRIFPAIDILKSGTRREEDLLTPEEREASWAIRREMQRQSSIDTMGLLLQYLKNTENNRDFIQMVLRNYGK
ncbi:MAG TPA: transcription termination factor Rho [Candidatus Avimonoglobus intestinipullorum]|uniref:Transcription termination factor Rho n=1 Tax=Candidatus Avimonoglobus intestinipullorum TaxID=2840699 RepID=A0A9D1LVC3_9FIRM|nr:transcription termination factor Rho [Candidatus Avimonoglobus intestinipullorum]